MPVDARKHVLELLAEHSYQFSEVGDFPLASGRKSDTYIDCKPTTMRGSAARAIAELFDPHIPSSAEAVGGLTAGADPIAYTIRDFHRGRQLDAFMVRKEAKGHGLKKFIEGPVRKGTRVVIVDDVVTAGGSTKLAIERCRNEELIVVAVVVLVDREEGGLETIRQAAGPDVRVDAIFTKSELRARWLERQSDASSDSPRATAASR